MTLKQLQVILNRITHSHFLEGRSIKYTNCDFDSRTKSFWKIEFRHWFGGKTTFTNTNRPKEEKRDLYEEIMEWLSLAPKKRLKEL